jgi:hypothetical protein
LKNDSPKIEEIKHKSNDLEAIIWSFFGVTTPESHFISQHFVKQLNMLGRRKITFHDFQKDANKFIRSSEGNERQQETLNKLVQIAKEIEERKKNND